MTGDDRYMVLHLVESWNQFPRCKEETFVHHSNSAEHVHGDGKTYTRDNDYAGLFDQYQIKNISHKLTPNFSQGNQIPLIGTGHQYDDRDHALPNYEMFIIPASHQDSDNRLEDLTGPQIDYWLNTTLRKGRRILPSRTQYIKPMRPTVVKYGAAQGKHQQGMAAMYMGRPNWYDTTAALLPLPDDTAVKHYTVSLLIRRVDGQPMTGNATAGQQGLSFRLDSSIAFTCRCSPKDGLAHVIAP